MEKLMRRKWLASLMVVLAIVAVMGLGTPALAATTATVTVTNTTQYLTISVAPTTYNFNATGAAHPNVLPNTTYYSNPGGQTTAPSTTVVDGECAFTITNGCNVASDLTVNWGDMSGGSDNSTNGNTGTQGATTFGAYTYWSGQLLSAKVLCKSADSGVAYSNLAATTNMKFGLQINEQTNAWRGASASTSTVTISVVAH